MKKAILLLFMLVIVLSVFACGNQPGDTASAGMQGSTQNSSETTEDQPASVLPHDMHLTQTASVTYNRVQARYTNIVLYRDGAKVGVLNNDGSIRIKASYDGLDALNDQYLVFQRDSRNGILTASGEEILVGEYNNFEYVGADYVILETATPCSANTPQAVASNGQYYKFDYSLFSLDTHAVVGNVDFSAFTTLSLSQCIATEHNLIIVNYEPDSKAHSFFVLYFQTNQWQEIDSLINVCNDGAILKNNIILDASGNKLLDAAELGYSNFLLKDDFEGIYFAFRDSTCFILNRNGDVIASADRTVYNDVKIQNDYIILPKESYYGVIDRNGNEIIPYRYDAVCFYTADIFAVKMNGYWGFVKSDGTTLLEPVIEADYNKYDHYFEIDQTRCLIDPYTGEIQKFERLEDLDTDKGIYEANDGNGYAIVTPQKALTEFNYDDIMVSNDGTVYVAVRGSVYDIYEVE